jgi:pimeloyl-ACP methyl ester carboxylesterase
MKPAHVVSLVTKDALKLSGLLFGPTEATVGFVFVHGLGSSVFSHNDVLPEGKSYVSLYINNRGHDKVASMKHVLPGTEKGYDWFPGGMAHEIFTDCVYDIQAGIEYLKDRGVEKIYLVGHSTGCQKSIFYLSRHENHDISGTVLICPMSDYAAAKKLEDPQKLAVAVKYAHKVVERGKPGDLIPSDIWPEPIDAQRFLSLYTPDSIEEIFCYSQPNRKPDLLQQIDIPLLVLLAQKDEYAYRPIVEIAEWFRRSTHHSTVQLIPDSLHSLTGKDEQTRALIKTWLATLP